MPGGFIKDGEIVQFYGSNTKYDVTRECQQNVFNLQDLATATCVKPSEFEVLEIERNTEYNGIQPWAEYWISYDVFQG